MSERNLDFDKVIDRRNTRCLKYDFAKRRGMPEDALPLWVADMDFATSSYIEDALIERAKLYTNNRVNKKIAVAAAEVEGGFYGRYTRVEEIIEFAHKIGAKKIGIATCIGLLEESRIFARILRLNGFEVYGISCKVASVNKTDIGIDEKYTCVTGNVMCNPIMQAKLLNKAKTDLNVVVGLCVGHDSLFYKYANGINTTLVTKDRVLAHNPIGALYQANPSQPDPLSSDNYNHRFHAR